MGKEITSAPDEMLQRSRLHYSAGFTLFEHNKLVHGISTFFDALEYGIRWFLTRHINVESISHEFEAMVVQLKEFLDWEKESFNPISFYQLMEEVLELEDEPNLEKTYYLDGLTYFFEVLGILPFELEIKPEDDLQTREILGI